MEIKDFLSPSDIVVDARVTDKESLLRDLSGRAAASLDLDGDFVASEVLKREELGSSATGGGIAIPHARLPEVAKPFGILARLRKAIAFDAIDGGPVDVVLLLLLPAAAGDEPLNALACAARTLRNAAVAGKLRSEGDGTELYRSLLGASEKAKQP
jgi:PTS system nitrogen regulatory IIA component